MPLPAILPWPITGLAYASTIHVNTAHCTPLQQAGWLTPALGVKPLEEETPRAVRCTAALAHQSIAHSPTLPQLHYRCAALVLI
jgi:hypothetical protein